MMRHGSGVGEPPPRATAPGPAHRSTAGEAAVIVSNERPAVTSRTDGRPVHALLVDGTVVRLRDLREADAALVAGFYRQLPVYDPGPGRRGPAIRAQSVQLIRGRGICRWSTASWWRKDQDLVL